MNECEEYLEKRYQRDERMSKNLNDKKPKGLRVLFEKGD